MALSKYLSAVAFELETKVFAELQSDGARFSLKACQRILMRAAEGAERSAKGEGAVDFIAAFPHETPSSATNVETEYDLLAAAECGYATAWAARRMVPSVSDTSAETLRDRLERFLQTRSPARSTGRVTTLKWLAGGRTKQTALLTLDGFQDLPSAVILRKDQAGSSTGTALRDEFPVLQYVHSQGLNVPRPYLFEPSGKVLGEPFILLARAPGSPAGDPLQGPPSLEIAVDLAGQLACLHRLPTLSIAALFDVDRQQYSMAFFAQSLIDMKSQWHTWARTPSMTVDTAFEWLQQHLSCVVSQPSIVHGDIGFYNILAENGRITAVLDWELAHLGHPAEDLGFVRYSFDDLDMWPPFMDAYIAAGGSAFSLETISFFTLWKALRGAIMMLYARHLFETAASDSIAFAEAPAHFLPILLFRMARELRVASHSL